MLDENILIGIQSSLILLMLGIIGFFAKSLIKNIKDLGEAITDLKIVVEQERVKYSQMEIQTHQKFERVELRLDDHQKLLNEHGLCIERIKTKFESD